MKGSLFASCFLANQGGHSLPEMRPLRPDRAMPARSSFSIDENERGASISRGGADRLLLTDINNVAKNTQRTGRR
jgi:hypothetical protein